MSQPKGKVPTHIKPKTIEIPSKVTTKLFAGFRISSEIRMHLNQSIQWKHATLLTASMPFSLQRIPYQGKEYLGFYLKSHRLTVKELREFQDMIKQEVNQYCPDLEVETMTVFIFPQVFIA
jgi:hypothetical protein